MMSCTKETLSNSSSSNYIEPSNTQGGGAVVYASFSCKTDDGKDGCNCEMTSSDDDCNYVQACKSGEIELSNYWATLNNMFTPEEIEQRSINHVRIVEPELRQALLDDGFPLKVD